MPLILVAPYKKTIIAQLLSGDLFYDNVVLHLHCDGNTFVDQKGKVISATAQLTTDVKKFGTGSAYFSAKNQLIQLPNTSDFTFNGDFTIEAWVYPTVLHAASWGILDFRTSGSTNAAWAFALQNAGGVYRPMIFAPGLASFTGTTTSVPLNEWSHIVLCRKGGIIRFFVNGVMDATTANAPGQVSGGSNPIIGSKDSNINGYGTIGYMDEIRITKDVGRYDSNFNVPTSAFPDNADYGVDPYLSNVAVLSHMNALQSNQVDYIFGGPIQSVGTTLRTDIKKFGTGSIDVSAGYLHFPSPMTVSATSTFTIEMWVYRTGPITHTLEALGVGNADPTAAGNRWSFGIHYTGVVCWYTWAGSSQRVQGTTQIPLNQWVHLAVSISNGVVKVFYNGTLEGQGTCVAPSQMQNGTLTVGKWNNWNLNALIDDLRITTNVARYSSSFLPPTSAHFSYSTWDAYWNSVVNASLATLTEGNLRAAIGGNRVIRANKTITTGKRYCEIKVNSWSGRYQPAIGIGDISNASVGYGMAKTYSWWTRGTALVGDSAGFSYGNGIAVGDVVGLLYDVAAGTMEFFKNGVSQGVMTNGIPAGEYYVFAASTAGESPCDVTANFGQSAWLYPANATGAVGFGS